MKQVITAFVAMACFAFLAWQPSQAQQPKAISVQIINLTGMDINVQGNTLVNNVPRKGAVLQIKKRGGVSFEQTFGGTTRYYTILDPLQPRNTLLLNAPINVPNRDLVLRIMPSPTNPKMLVIVAD